jgi:menaquinone-9 beta-reductase
MATAPEHADAIVVGAGPGGASTAYHLARRDRRVLLLDRATFPRDKSCGDALTRSAIRLLGDMEVLPRLEKGTRILGVRVFMRGKGSRDFEYPRDLTPPNHGLVVPRLELDHVLCQHAVTEGAELWEGTTVSRLLMAGGAVVGVEAVQRGRRRQLRAPVVVAADGAGSRLAGQAGLARTAAADLGSALRGYYTDVEGLGNLLEIYTPLLDPTDRYLLPSYGWVFPVGPTTVNLGVGLFAREHGTNVRELFARFLDTLRREDPRFERLKPLGSWKGAPLRFDFAPERCTAPGLLLVGDAAGMISPFTGEGISYALESGRLAAATIDRSLARTSPGSVPDLAEYPQLLGQSFIGDFERQAARRYLFTWHVLESTFHNDRPLFSLARQVALFPEGLGESFTSTLLDDVGGWLEKDLPLRADLLAIAELLIAAVRHDWPFLARVFAADRRDGAIPFRPALLLLLASYLATPRRPQVLIVGAAVELGYLAALAQVSVDDEPGGPPASDSRDRGQAHWANLFAMIVGDFLLSAAYELSSQVSGEVSRRIADALARSSEGRVRELRDAFRLELTPKEYLETLERKTATLFELPCRLGALLSGAHPAQANALSEYGRHLGMAFQLAEDVQALAGGSTRVGRALQADISEGIYGFPILWAARQGGPSAMELRDLLKRRSACPQDRRRALDLARTGGGDAEALRLAREYARRAQAALEGLPDDAARRSLAQLANYAVSRVDTGGVQGSPQETS